MGMHPEARQVALGNALHPRVYSEVGADSALANKVTGMILELDLNEVVELQHDRAALKEQVNIALALLQEKRDKAAAGPADPSGPGISSIVLSQGLTGCMTSVLPTPSDATPGASAAALWLQKPTAVDASQTMTLWFSQRHWWLGASWRPSTATTT